ncbi:MAG: hypothetical protein PVI27_11095 [Desulfobacteraceae bacterium]|jgi:hypothetical protein
MSDDPFGNLQEWGEALELLDEFSRNGRLAECQRGLVRILNYRGNWRLREEVLKRLDQIEAPTDELIGQVLSILADDNTYYEARIMASGALMHFLKKAESELRPELNLKSRKLIEKLCQTPQPPVFEKALQECNQALA